MIVFVAISTMLLPLNEKMIVQSGRFSVVILLLLRYEIFAYLQNLKANIVGSYILSPLTEMLQTSLICVAGTAQ